MAIENHIILNGIIRSIRKSKLDNEIKQITIGLEVMRRPKAAAGNRLGDSIRDVIIVVVRSPEYIKYLCDHNAANGDLLEVSGVFCTIRAIKKFHCEHCHEENSYEGVSTYVHPLCLRLNELHPKKTEIIKLTQEERYSDKERIMKCLYAKKVFPGDILAIQELEADTLTDGSQVYNMQIVVREKATPEDITNWMFWMSEISNRIYIMGNLCSEPQYIPKEMGGKLCVYQLGINRSVYIKEDDASIKADYPWVRSLGEQAEADYRALSTGSLVFIDGSVQSRKGFKMTRECSHCGKTCTIQGNTMEIVPYKVEYLRDCTLPEEKKEEIGQSEGDE